MARRRKKKDPNAPKRGLSAYILYSRDNRPRLRAAHPDVPHTGMFKILADAWKNAPADVKADYEAKSAADKLRYTTEMEEYKKNKPESGSSSSSSSSSDSDKKKKKKKKSTKKKKDPNAPKRPMNAYFLFSQDNRQKFKEQNPETPHRQIFGLLSEAWKNVTPEEKARYEARAATEKERYAVAIAAYNEKKESEAATAESGGEDDASGSSSSSSSS